ncbi:hypothetical protein ELH75_16535 [Rhizobium leguminosarum]|nr:hypothetical protein ELI50_13795 [Rhizobium leguminosarum]TBZ45996.1 hypothetical protein E0H44_15410 [Rhizobium leguminosarum bv. viciae]TAU41579.1 hypothetical protein ELI51_14510 [Rhizobium leguminosarum]TAV11980.1 hypothetical protein ELI37_16505 [Rhizobium leguminosarum]TAX51695.1 hypothetical protein ELH99_16745 [Rhizobium leguminosarum]
MDSAISHLRGFLESICQPTHDLTKRPERVLADARRYNRDVKALHDPQAFGDIARPSHQFFA